MNVYTHTRCARALVVAHVGLGLGLRVCRGLQPGRAKLRAARPDVRRCHVGGKMSYGQTSLYREYIEVIWDLY